MEPTVRLDHRQQQTLSPRLQHAVRLLQMSSLDFVHELHEVVNRNPFLEQEEVEGEEPDIAEVSAATGVTPAQIAAQEPVEIAEQVADAAGTELEEHNTAESFDAATAADNERDTWLNDGSTPTHHGEDGQLGALDLVPFRAGLR